MFSPECSLFIVIGGAVNEDFPVEISFLTTGSIRGYLAGGPIKMQAAINFDWR